MSPISSFRFVAWIRRASSELRRETRWMDHYRVFGTLWIAVEWRRRLEWFGGGGRDERYESFLGVEVLVPHSPTGAPFEPNSFGLLGAKSHRLRIARRASCVSGGSWRRRANCGSEQGDVRRIDRSIDRWKTS